MATPDFSDVTTHGIRVGATAFFLPEHSDAQEERFVFGYTVVIANNSERTVELQSRHWIIIDATGHREEVRGPGVVGQKPRLEPGQAFKYQSFCPLSTSWGTMEGTYQMRSENGDAFEIAIGRFYLTTPKAMAARSAE